MGGRHANERGNGSVTDGWVDDLQMEGTVAVVSLMGDMQKEGMGVVQWVGGHCVKERENGRITDGRHENERGWWYHRWVMCNERGWWLWCHGWAMCE